MRNGPISPVTIELREEHYAAEFTRLAKYSGAWGPGVWKHPRCWRIEVVVHWRFVCPGTDHAYEHVEYWEHWVLAANREQAIACLVRDLKREPDADAIQYAAVYRVRPPLEAPEVREIEQYNGRLLLERARRVELARPAGRQMELVLT